MAPLHALPVALCLHSHSSVAAAAADACEPPRLLQLLLVHLLPCYSTHAPCTSASRATTDAVTAAAYSDYQQLYAAVRCNTRKPKMIILLFEALVLAPYDVTQSANPDPTLAVLFPVMMTLP